MHAPPPMGSAADRTLAVLRKELLDIFRDRRTGMVTLLSSIAAGPIFLLLIFNLIASQSERAARPEAAGPRRRIRAGRSSRSSSGSRSP